MADRVEQFELEVQEETARPPNRPFSSQLLFLKQVTIPGSCSPPHIALIDDSILNARNQDGDTALHIAATLGHNEAVQQLRRWGASPDGRGHRLRTSLHCAAAHGHLESVRGLVITAAHGDRKADVNARDMDGATPLSLAVAEHLSWRRRNEEITYIIRGHWDIISMLIENHADVNLPDIYGDTPVIRAAKTDQWELVKMLINKGASISCCRHPEESLLALAADGGKVDLVQDLLRRGAAEDADQVTGALKTARNGDVVWVLANAVPSAFWGQSGEQALRCAAENGRQDALRALLQAGVVSDADGVRELTSACGQMTCWEMLVEWEDRQSTGIRDEDENKDATGTSSEADENSRKDEELRAISKYFRTGN